MPVAPMARKKKPSFSKVYRPDGWKGIVEMSENPLALRLFAFLCTNCDHLNAVVASVELLAEELDCHVRSVRRAAKWLEEHSHIAICRIGTANCYIVNAQEVFHNLDKYQNYVAISSKALTKKDSTLRRRLTHLIQGQGDLFSDAKDDPNA